jgi:serine/threonine-protein kinase
MGNVCTSEQKQSHDDEAPARAFSDARTRLFEETMPNFNHRERADTVKELLNDTLALERRPEAKRQDVRAVPSHEYATPYRTMAPIARARGVEIDVAVRTGDPLNRKVILAKIDRRLPELAEVRKRLVREAAFSARLSHPALTGLIEVGEQETCVFAAFEHVEGTTLERLNERLRAVDRTLPFEMACYIAEELLRAVCRVHQVGASSTREGIVTFRHICPRNVHLTPSGQVKLDSFALGAELSLGVADQVYCAPESQAGEVHDSRSDVYAVGMILFELLIGRTWFHPHTAESPCDESSMSKGAIRALERDRVPQALVRIVERATHRSPAARFPSPASMLAALEAWLFEQRRPVTPTSFERCLSSYGFFRHQLPIEIPAKSHAAANDVEIVRPGEAALDHLGGAKAGAKKPASSSSERARLISMGSQLEEVFDLARKVDAQNPRARASKRPEGPGATGAGVVRAVYTPPRRRRKRKKGGIGAAAFFAAVMMIAVAVLVGMEGAF